MRALISAKTARSCGDWPNDEASDDDGAGADDIGVDIAGSMVDVVVVPAVVSVVVSVAVAVFGCSEMDKTARVMLARCAWDRPAVPLSAMASVMHWSLLSLLQMVCASEYAASWSIVFDMIGRT